MPADQKSPFEGEESNDREFVGLHVEELTTEETVFRHCKFIDCRFSACSFVDCAFDKCLFDRCDLSLLGVAHTSFRETYFLSSKAIGINWTQSANPAGIHFKDCVINYSVFFGMALTRMKMVHCVAHEVNFADANLTGAILRETDFQNSLFSNTNLTGADLQGAENYAIHPNHNTLKKTIFSLPEAISLLSTLDIILK
jgi:fluoroquinolone resistance protein